MKQRFFLMTIFYSCLYLLSSQYLFAVEKHNIPPLEGENKRWFIPSQYWGKTNHFLMKGKYYSIEFFSNLDSSLKIYNDRQKSKLLLTVWAGIDIANGVRCEAKHPYSTVLAKSYAKCEYLNCKILNGPKEIDVYNPNIDENLFVLDKATRQYKQECPYKLDLVFSPSQGKDRGSIVNFRFSELLSKENLLEIKINGEKAFLDISLCKEEWNICKVTDAEKSEYELAWLKIRNHQAYKDIPELNDLIQNLLPCVKKRDISCVKKYFISSTDINLEVQPLLRNLSLKNLTFDSDLLAELEACLSYDKLLPFNGLRTKGINKVCMINNGYISSIKMPPGGKTKMISVVFPEGVNYDSGYKYVKIK